MSRNARAVDSREVDWGELRRAEWGRGRSARHGLERLCLEDDRIYQIRLVGRPIRFFRHYIPIAAISPGLEHDVCWQAGFQPLERYAVLILDRQDRNSLKLLEDGPVLFNRFAWHRPLTKAKDRGPGGRLAPDWLVRVVYPRVMRNGCLVKAYRHRDIVLEQLGESKLTPDEQERINGNPFSMQDVFAPTSPELIVRLFDQAMRLERGGGR